MRLVTPVLTALLVVALAASSALAAKRTYGSNLHAPATVSEAHQADTAFWPVSIRGDGPGAPADGQILRIRLKGMAIKEPGGPAPLNEVHFQHLVPRAGGSMFIAQSTAPFYVPYTGRRDQISEFVPENLCVKQGDVINFNDEGGWGGPSSPFYQAGVPFRVFGSVSSSSTARFTKDQGTNNGDTLYPTVVHDQELLMQLVLGTGMDVSEPCGGPRRHPDGSLVKLPKKMHVVTPQRAYVRSNRRVEPTAYCASKSPCLGHARLESKGQTIAKARFLIAPEVGAHIPMRLTRAAYRALRRAGDAQHVRFVLKAGKAGPFASVITIRH
jgi:hypothetical protein